MISTNILPKWFQGVFSVAPKFHFWPAVAQVAAPVIGGLLGGSSGGGSKKSTQTTAPWEAQQPYLKEIFEEAQGLYSQGDKGYYDGQLTPDVNGNMQSAFQNPNIQADQGFLNNYRANTNALTDGNNVFDQSTMNTVMNNPYVQQQVDSLKADVNQNAGTQIAQNNMNAGMMGSTGSASAAVQNALVQNDANKTIANASMNLRNNAFNQGINAGFQGAGNRLTSLGMQGRNNLAGLQTLYSQSANNFDNTMQAGMTEYGVAQDAINAELAKWAYNTNEPWANLDRYRSMVSGNYGGASTASTPNPSVAEGVLGGAMAGAGIWSKFQPTKG